MFAAGKTSAVGGQLYVDDVFSTWLYTGNGSTQTITNGINLSVYGGLVWAKTRGPATTYSYALSDTARGTGKQLASNLSNAQQSILGLTSFDSSGFTLGNNQNFNSSGELMVSWTFRKAPKFFDVVTYTGNGANRTVAHSLGQVPGMILVKRTDTPGDWEVYHRSLANTNYLVLNTTAGQAADATMWNSTTATSSVFSLGTNTNVNDSGGTYVAYLFSHNTATDGMIQCGSFTTDGSGNAAVILGWEPQFVIAKAISAVAEWKMLDTMRGWSANTASNALLRPNTTNAELTGQSDIGFPAATGIDVKGLSVTTTYIYLTIRRPNKPPTTGTQVFSPIASSAATGTALTTSFPVDLQIFGLRTGTTNKGQTADRLRGISSNTSDSGFQLITNSNAGETSGSLPTLAWNNTGFQMPSSYGGASMIFWNFRRAPGVFDEVCYAGSNVNTTQPHNLGVVPEFMIVKNKSALPRNWTVYSSSLTNTYYILLNSSLASGIDTTYWNSTSPTSTVFSIGTNSAVNATGSTYVAYLFATSPGISKVFSYTGNGGSTGTNGSSQTINCGFTTGARFVLIKRTDSIGGDWYVWDSARGIVAGNDPHLSLNNTTAEVTTDDSVDTDNTGFIVNQVATTNVNVTSATYIGLAFA